MTSRIKSRRELVSTLKTLSLRMEDFELDTLPDTPITIETTDIFNIANTDRILEQIINTMIGLSDRCQTPRNVLQTMFLNLTSENTAKGYLAQFQGYKWLLDQHANFNAEIKHSATIRGTTIDLDGCFDVLSKRVFFDIKSFGFEPEMRETFIARLQQKFPGYIFTIDGDIDHSPEIVQEEVFKNLNAHIEHLRSNDQLVIKNLNWRIRKQKLVRPHAYIQEQEFDPEEFTDKNKHVPLRYSSQFTTDAPYILFFVLPDGLGSSGLKSDTFSYTEKLFNGMAKYLFYTAIADQSAASKWDKSVPAGIAVADCVKRLGGLACYAPQASLAVLHLNAKASSPISLEEARSIAAGWKISLHT